eukprot:6891398-Prorocentrum_lima.AAC.1
MCIRDSWHTTRHCMCTPTGLGRTIMEERPLSSSRTWAMSSHFRGLCIVPCSCGILLGEQYYAPIFLP